MRVGEWHTDMGYPSVPVEGQMPEDHGASPLGQGAKELARMLHAFWLQRSSLPVVGMWSRLPTTDILSMYQLFRGIDMQIAIAIIMPFFSES